MKKLVYLIAIAAIASLSLPALAGSGCCGAMKKLDSATPACPVLSDLTPDQQAKVEAAHKKCAEAGCSKESCEQMMKDLEGVLSADQLAQCKTAMEKSEGCVKKGMSGCPAMKTEKVPAPAEAPAPVEAPVAPQ